VKTGMNGIPVHTQCCLWVMWVLHILYTVYIKCSFVKYLDKWTWTVRIYI
jgi:hypothetical protein